MIKSAILALAAAGALASAAAAQDAHGDAAEGDAATITGAWRFETLADPNGCIVEGEMAIEEIAPRHAYSCTFAARETCPGFNIQADQICSLTRDGADARIFSQVNSTTPESQTYLPDDFTLRIQSDSLMTGILRSGSLPDVEVTFVRDQGLVS